MLYVVHHRESTLRYYYYYYICILNILSSPGRVTAYLPNQSVSLLLSETMKRSASLSLENPWQARVNPKTKTVSGALDRTMLLEPPSGPVARGLDRFRRERSGRTLPVNSLGQGEGNDDLAKDATPISRHLMPSLAGVSLSAKHWIFSHSYDGEMKNAAFDHMPSVTPLAIPASNLAAMNYVLASLQADWITNKRYDKKFEHDIVSEIIKHNAVEGVIASGSSQDSNTLIGLGPEFQLYQGNAISQEGARSSEYHAVTMSGQQYCYNIFETDPLPGGKIYFVLKRVKCPSSYNLSDRDSGHVVKPDNCVSGRNIFQFVPVALAPGTGIPREIVQYTKGDEDSDKRVYMGYPIMVGMVMGMVPESRKSEALTKVKRADTSFSDASMGTDLQAILVDVNIRF